MTTSTRRVFVVVRQHWHYNDENMVHFGDEPVKAFTDRGQADAYLDRQARRPPGPSEVDDLYCIVEMDVEF
jgi:hypothetical protein